MTNRAAKPTALPITITKKKRGTLPPSGSQNPRTGSLLKIRVRSSQAARPLASVYEIERCRRAFHHGRVSAAR